MYGRGGCSNRIGLIIPILNYMYVFGVSTAVNENYASEERE